MTVLFLVELGTFQPQPASFIPLLTLNPVPVAYAAPSNSAESTTACFSFSGQMGTEKKDCYPDSCAGEDFPIYFQRRFLYRPKVTVSLASLEVDKNYNLRVTGTTEGIQSHSFVLKHKTWDDTKIFMVKFSWIACA